MRVKLEKEVIEIKEKVVEIKCDVCGSIIETEEEYNSDKRKGGYFYRVNTRHRDWGNDSIDSSEWYDLCSDECMKSFFDKYLLEEDSETACLEFEREKI